MNEGFFEAIRQGDEAAVDAALQADDALLRARDSAGLSPVLVAAYSGRPELAERLAARQAAEPGGLDVFEASVSGDAAAVRRLLDGRRASVEDRGPDGFTPLHLAAFFGRLDVARLLLERSADPNAVAANESRVTPLHSAVAARHRDVASLLLALGASVNVVQHGGLTPLHAAAQHGDDALVDLLLVRGADPTLPADDRRTAVDFAEAAGHRALAERLREAAGA